MYKHIILLALLGLTMLASCQNKSKPDQTQTVNAEDSSATKSAEPDDNDLLRTLEGRWQSEREPGYVLEIADTQASHYRDGVLVLQSMIDVDGACTGAICRPEGVDTSDGWCFTETTITAGKYDPQCHFVTHCDAETLHYRSLSKSGKEYAFKKIQ